MGDFDQKLKKKSKINIAVWEWSSSSICTNACKISITNLYSQAPPPKKEPKTSLKQYIKHNMQIESRSKINKDDLLYSQFYFVSIFKTKCEK